MSPNGKLDKRALPDPEMGKTEDYVKPANQLQKELVQIWSEILSIDESEIGVNMNFFDIGGDSLKLAMMTNKVNEQFEVDIPVATMFKLPVISLIADHLGKNDEKDSEKMEKSLGEDVDQMNDTLDLLQQLNA